MRAQVWLLGLVLGCSGRTAGDADDTVADETGTDADSETTSNDSSNTETETGMTCEEVCDAQCAAQIDECGHPMEGSCSPLGDECYCNSNPACPPCDPADCGWWETCYEGAASCDYCSGDFSVAWDPEAPCEIAIPDGLPDFLAQILEVRIATDFVVSAADCQNDAAWMWKTPWTVISLCPLACTAFESIGQADLSWTFPCE